MMNVLFNYALARRLEGTGATATVFHPGLVKSELTRHMPKKLYYIFKTISAPPDKAAKRLSLLAVDDKYGKTNGRFFRFDDNEIRSIKYSYYTDIQEQLWKISEGLMTR